MAEKFLKIQNKGVAPHAGLTILGVSTTRKAGRSDTIGEFGSGSKMAISLLLREGIAPVIYCGLTKLEFEPEDMVVDDGLDSNTYRRVIVTISEPHGRRRREPLGFVLEHGQRDWTDINMALREFVSNALDRSIREGIPLPDITISEATRAKDGYTTIFIPLTPAVQKFYGELPARFLAFSEPEMLDVKVLPKGKLSRSISGSRKAMIYKKGVFVRESSTDEPSLFDYNLGEELTLDESRNVDEYAIRAACATAVADAEPAVLCDFVKKVVLGTNDVWEKNLPMYNFKLFSWDREEKKTHRRTSWSEAWRAAAGENAVASALPATVRYLVEEKGFKPTSVSGSWLEALENLDIPTDKAILSDVEMGCRLPVPATELMETGTEWAWLTVMGAIGSSNCSRSMPTVSGFRNLSPENNPEKFYYRDGTISFDVVVETASQIRRFALTGCIQHILGTADYSDEFRDMLLTVAVHYASSGEYQV